MQIPLVSWHTLTYDRPELLRELLGFFLCQTYWNRELIIVNDQENITYHTPFKNVKIYNIPERFSSLGEKRNFAMSKCSGEYIIIADDDDLFEPNHTEHLVKHHMENPEYDIVMDRYCSFSEDKKVVNEKTTPEGFNRCCIKKEFALKNKFDPNLNIGEDVDLLKRANVLRIENIEMHHHYRWGMDTYHISGLGDFDLTDVEKQKDAWGAIEKEFTQNREVQDILLTPLFYTEF